MTAQRALLVRITVAVLAVALLAVILLRTLPESGLQQQVREIRAAGWPASSAELNNWCVAIPPKENAALLVTKAILHHVSAPDSLSYAPLPLAGAKLDPALARDLAKHLQANRATLDLLHGAAQLPASRYPLDFSKGPDALLPPLAKIKAFSILLRHEALLHASTSNRSAAVQSVLSGIALARSLRNEPTLISQLVRISSHAIAIDSLEKTLGTLPLTAAELQAISQRLAEAEADGRTGISRALIGERAGAIDYVTRGHSLLSNSSSGSSLAEKSRMTAYRLLGLHKRDLSLYLDSTARFVDALTNDIPAALARSAEVKRDMDQKLSSWISQFGITRSIIPAHHKAITKVAAINTQTRCARAALAVERFRLHHRRLPADLDELVPLFLDETPVDPVEGEPLKYAPRAQSGFYISSPGAAATLKNRQQTTFGVYRSD